jgi:myo-inositol 2-dehydrogenase / D-chiro-inositol 1-dehydrogenase
MNKNIQPHEMTRRNFLASATAASALTLLKPSAVWGQDSGDKISLGLIGCGGRGGWMADLFAASGKFNLVACADYFPERANNVGDKHKIDTARRYTGLSSCQRLLESKLDAVAIETPPYFHPAQAAAAVAAGKHVFLAKPIAVDAPGCQTVEKSGQAATQKQLVFLVDFQTRAHALYQEAVRRVHHGDMGALVMARAHYPWSGGNRQAPPSTAEERLRNWYNVLPYSGDFIVEQAIHALDVASWIINSEAVKATGMGGRKLRAPGSIWDHFVVNYQFANEVPLSFSCIQTIPEMKDEITCRAYGAEGYIDTDYFGSVWIRGNEPFKGGSVGNLYLTGAQANIVEFHRCITEKHHENLTAAASVRSNLLAVLGREAAYRGGEVSLQDLLKEGKTLEPDLKGLRDS